MRTRLSCTWRCWPRTETEPVTWTVRNEVRAVDRLRRKLERARPGQPPRRANPKNDVPRHPAPPLVVEAASGCGSSKPRNTGECTAVGTHGRARRSTGPRSRRRLGGRRASGCSPSCAKSTSRPDRRGSQSRRGTTLLVPVRPQTVHWVRWNPMQNEGWSEGNKNPGML